MLPGKHIIPNHHFTKQGQSPKGRKKPCLMHGMANIVSHYTPMIGTTLHSSPLGDDIDTAQPHKGTLPQVTATPDDMMKLSLPSQTKQNVLTIPSFGLIQLRKVSSKPHTGWTSVEDMESPSILGNSDLPKMKLNLLALRSQMIQCDHVRSTLGPYLTFPSHRA